MKKLYYKLMCRLGYHSWTQKRIQICGERHKTPDIWCWKCRKEYEEIFYEKSFKHYFDRIYSRGSSIGNHL